MNWRNSPLKLGSMKKTATTAPFQLDDFDRAILEIVQVDASLTHAEIGEQVHLSASSVRRRLAALRSCGVIRRDVSLVDPERFGVTLIVTLTFEEESLEAYEALDRQIQIMPEIKQSYHVAGSDDYVLIVHGPSLQWYEDWAKATFMSNPALKRYSTSVVWSCKKFETAIAIPSA